jgi:hypothetical protein
MSEERREVPFEVYNTIAKGIEKVMNDAINEHDIIDELTVVAACLMGIVVAIRRLDDTGALSRDLITLLQQTRFQDIPREH